MAIPRHAFLLWLAIRDGLPTGERLLKWDAKGDVHCLICMRVIKSHGHLFFVVVLLRGFGWHLCRDVSR